MALSIFGEKTIKPTDEMLAEVLGEREAIWDCITEHVEITYGKMLCEWKFYSKSAGWSFVVKSGKRTMIYLIPLNGYFKANFVFGEKAVAAAQMADLPESVLKEITEATVYAEGRSFMINVAEDADAVLIEKLLKIKRDN